MKITLNDLFGKWINHPDATEERKTNSEILLHYVNGLLADAEADGVKLKTNPNTGTLVSGQTLGGFRPSDATQGAKKSAHMQGQAVDIYDPKEYLDSWIMAHKDKLVQYDLYMEHPSATKGWCHLSTRRPGSGNRVFYP